MYPMVLSVTDHSLGRGVENSLYPLLMVTGIWQSTTRTRSLKRHGGQVTLGPAITPVTKLAEVAVMELMQLEMFVPFDTPIV